MDITELLLVLLRPNLILHACIAGRAHWTASRGIARGFLGNLVI
jgi:hypothetical protein